jgi:hypothetical protein
MSIFVVFIDEAWQLACHIYLMGRLDSSNTVFITGNVALFFLGGRRPNTLGRKELKLSFR